jgi:nucleoside 2-deoxyribosyltransferase
MANFKDRSRKLARERFWEENNRDQYYCPDCDRLENEVHGKFEVHHKNGEPLDNRPENHVALCRLCHMLREGKKPSTKNIKKLRKQLTTNSEKEAKETKGTPSVYLAGSMDDEGTEHQTWRSSVAEKGDTGTYKYTGSTPIKINSPTTVMYSHGAGPVKGVVSDDMELIEASDAIVAYFEKKEQTGTLTELTYAVSQGMPALVLFDSDLLSGFQTSDTPWDDLSGGIEHQFQSPVYWFLINFLSEQGWGGLDANIELKLVDSRDGIKDAFADWQWHQNKIEETYRNYKENR